MPPNPSANQQTVGLTTHEAATRLDRFGPNEPAETQKHSFLSDILKVFKNPLVLILVLAAIASAFLGEAVDAGIIATVVLLSAAIDLCCAAESGKRFGGER